MVPDWGYCQRHCGRFQFSQPLYSVCQGDTDSWSVSLDTLQCKGQSSKQPSFFDFSFNYHLLEATSIVTVVGQQIQVVSTDTQCILNTTNLPKEYRGHSLNAYKNLLYLCGGQDYYGKECLKFDLADPASGIFFFQIVMYPNMYCKILQVGKNCLNWTNPWKAILR